MMELVAWFGRVDPESTSIVAARDVNQIVEELTCPSPIPEKAQHDLRELAKACHYVEDDGEYNRLLREVALELVRRELRSLATVEQDALQMIEALDDIDKSINLLEERLYEWSLLHRDDIARSKDLPLSLAGQEPIGELATAVMDLRRSRQRIEEGLSSSISTIAPNLSELAGPLLAARLISKAGGLRRLSELPSSTVQIIGAEKSLFKHLKGKAPSPKHGLIYRHPAIMNAPKRLRGRLSRALSGKLAIAARIDYHSGVISPELKVSLENRLSEIRRTGLGTKQSKRNL
jgi:nucleolar protein 56